MNILQKIVAEKHREVAERKALFPIKLLESSLFYESDVVSMRRYLHRTDKVGIIAEIKRSAPSTGKLAGEIDIRSLSIGYMQAGASALSILTDRPFFSGCEDDIKIARKYNYCPILRKDFIVDEYQVIESRSIGADCILLIAACLSVEKCRRLARLAKSIGLEVLLEVHSRLELESYLSNDMDIVGVNNRDLQSFETNLDVSKHIVDYIPDGFTKISESGISSYQDVLDLKNYGFNGFLIGTQFMRHAQPEVACKNLIIQIENEKHEMENLRSKVS